MVKIKVVFGEDSRVWNTKIQVENVCFGGLQNADAKVPELPQIDMFNHLHFRVRHKLSVYLNTKPQIDK